MNNHKSALVFLILIVASFTARAQSSNDSVGNVAIFKAIKVIRFVKGNTENPVLVKTEDNRVYTCRKYRTEIPVAELYNDTETIDDIHIEIDSKKRPSSMVTCEYYNRDGIFYSDEHICYFNLPITRINGKSEVKFNKTTTDPRYFTSVYFSSNLPIEEQEVIIYVPDWMKVEFRQRNLEGCNMSHSKTRDGKETVYRYTIKNLPAYKRELYSPGISHFAPHLLVLCKSAELTEGTITYFNTLQDQYNWYYGLLKQVSNDNNAIRPKVEEIINGASTDEEKVKKIFMWVQENIRYIAFEDGIAGFRPESAQEVLKKKYGDCKGMANLLTVMLQSIQLDARRCWIGTKDIAYDYETPSLSVDNHMICAWMYKEKPVFLDATEKYIGFGEVAERIQGRQTLIENGNKFILEKVPVAKYTQNTSSETRKLLVEGNHLKGHVVHIWKGENKEWILSQLAAMKQDKQETAIRMYLAEGEGNFEISNLKITNINDYNKDLHIEYDVFWKNSLTSFDNDIYFSLDNREHLKDFDIDTAKRKLPLWQPFKDNLVFETELVLPKGKIVAELPEMVQIKQPKYSFLASYTLAGDKLIYRNEIIINSVDINPHEFARWNADIKQLSTFYNQQVTLKPQ